jgi:sugar O-acyltransferase (sialic acid O-acetyltransferase NeuD family)
VHYLVVGAAGHAQEVAWSLREQTAARGERADLLFFDDRVAPARLPSGLGEIVGGLDAIAAHVRPGATQLVLGVGLPRVKATIVGRLSPLGVPWATVIHPGATIGPNVTIGEGSYIAAGAILTVNVRIGRFATINLHCQVAHDGVLDDLVTLHPDTHLSGNATIGEGSELGTGTLVIPGVRIGCWAVLGAGCVAVRSLDGGHVYVGVPAAVLQRGPGAHAARQAPQYRKENRVTRRAR